MAVQLMVEKLTFSGRDLLVSNAVGTNTFGGVTYTTTAKNLTGLVAAGSAGYDYDMH